MVEWRRVRLGDVAELLTGFPFKSAEYTDAPDGVRLLRGDNVIQGQLRWDGVKRWPSTSVAPHAAYSLRADDIVLAMDRPWIEAGLKYAILSASDLPALLVQRVARLRGRAGVDTRFLGCVVGSQRFTDYVLAIQTGTAVPHISGPTIKTFEFDLPPLNEQRAIAGILGALDDKIAVNRRMGATLEAMARAIFKSWFVDFDPVHAKAAGLDPGLSPDLAALFPDDFETGEAGDLPASWSAVGLDRIARYMNGLALQKYPVSGDDGLPVIKIAQLRAGHTANADRASAALPADYVVEDGDVLFSWSGSLECFIWSGGRGALNQHLFKVTSSVFPKWFFYLWTLHHLDDFRAIAKAKATTMGHIQRHHLAAALAKVPPLALVEASDQVIGPFIAQVEILAQQSNTLADLRDALLPKLISGKIRVPESIFEDLY